jgi:hypothetical protein
MKMRADRLRLIIEGNLLLMEGAVGGDYAREIMLRFPRGMEAIGIPSHSVESLPVVGTGTHGTAFETPDGRIIKVTNDSKEAQAAATLLGQFIPSIVNYYDVWEFGDTGLFGLLQEKLVPLEKPEAQAFNDALVATGLPVWIRRAPGDWDKVKELTKRHILNKVRKKFPDEHNSPAAQRFAHEANAQWNMLVTRYRVKDMFETLSGLDIDFHDYHAGNLMKRPGTGELVLIDLGISVIRTGAGGTMRSMTERRMRR